MSRPRSHPNTARTRRKTINLTNSERLNAKSVKVNAHTKVNAYKLWAFTLSFHPLEVPQISPVRHLPVCSAGASDFRRSRTRAKARVAACVTGSRQSPDCRRPLPPRRPRAFARPFRFFPEIVRASRRALGCRNGRLAPALAEIAGRRGARGGRLRRGCGAMLSSRAAPHPHPPRRAPPGGALRLASSRLPLLRPHASAHRQ